MTKQKKIIMVSMITLVLVIGLTIGGIWLYDRTGEYGFEQALPEGEKTLRKELIAAAEAWLGCNEKDGSHQAIIDLYNSYEPLARGYPVQYDDEWCASFVSAAAIEAELTQIIPTECGCERQIELFQQLGTWQEADDYKPLPGDIIYYCRSNPGLTGDCTRWSDHVGIVVGTRRNMIKVIEGNYGDKVAYRYLSVDASIIRGFAVPDYARLAHTEH